MSQIPCRFAPVVRRTCAAKIQRRSYATVGVSRAYDLAVQVLETEREALRRRIRDLEGLEKKGEESKAEKELLRARVELAYSDPATHAAFATGKGKRLLFMQSDSRQCVDPCLQIPGDVAEPVYATMHDRRWRSFLVPKLLKLEEEHGVIGDALPEAIIPQVNLEVNFQNTNWLCAYGQPVPPVWTLYSPQLTITTGDEKVRHFTVALIDLDRPDPESGSYEEWCHWLVTDIPVQNRLVIPGGSSPLLQPATSNAESQLAGAHFVPSPPTEQPTIPGNVIFPYVPAHPPASNPRKVHRYLLAVLEQPEPNMKLDTENIKAQVQTVESPIEEKPQKDSVPTWERSVEGEGEKRMMVRERLVLRSWKISYMRRAHNRLSEDFCFRSQSS